MLKISMALNSFTTSTQVTGPIKYLPDPKSVGDLCRAQVIFHAIFSH